MDFTTTVSKLFIEFKTDNYRNFSHDNFRKLIFLESSRKVVLSFLVLMKVWRSKLTVYDSSEILSLERAQHRRKIRIIEGNAKYRQLKKLTC